VKIDVAFPRRVGAVLLVAACIGGYPLVRYGSAEITLGVVSGAALSTLNVLLGFLAIEYSFDKSYRTFLRAVLGGMGLRMALMLATMLVLILGFQVHAIALTLSMLGFYVIYLVLEILFIQQKVTIRDQQ
jgi:hypothetical protein